ncbi:Co2+/Mg2+ efflux protein ApaG [Aliifodinibius sp. S!AR15-10]|uniref:Co2+/Mg2+ efflux protein ApaG n=1 Tax=Aliifodinibius sp. S!AR15-10 TaxID=2950437 RepID=UPI0028617D49|nr:Co2+/Mg2+ efflux protein ApaG [Aliifodinibius sp. S!AR15-10]MDR8393789.1 Co2+/Mg2+ efflux protein ApaG [Aliifodinibius sp. S!AR15-10]
MQHTKTFTEISHDVEVEVRPLYLEDQSNPVERKNVFVYFITIRNHGDENVRLLKRHWAIEDSIGQTYEVDGDGVVGKKPVIEPGEEFEYNSSCVLKSYSGVMEGYYIMEHETMGTIKVKIPRFVLRSHRLN